MAREWVGCGQVRTVGLGSLCGRRAREGEVVVMVEREQGRMGGPPTRAGKKYDFGRAAAGSTPRPKRVPRKAFAVNPRMSAQSKAGLIVLFAHLPIPTPPSALQLSRNVGQPSPPDIDLNTLWLPLLLHRVSYISECTTGHISLPLQGKPPFPKCFFLPTSQVTYHDVICCPPKKRPAIPSL